MSVSPILTGGIGSFGGIRAIPTLGFNFSSAAPPSGGAGSISAILTQGIGVFGDYSLIAKLGFGPYASPTPEPETPDTPGGGGFVSQTFSEYAEKSSLEKRKQKNNNDLIILLLKTGL